MMWAVDKGHGEIADALRYAGARQAGKIKEIKRQKRLLEVPKDDYRIYRNSRTVVSVTNENT